MPRSRQLPAAVGGRRRHPSRPPGRLPPALLDGVLATLLVAASLWALWSPPALPGVDFRDPDGLGVGLVLVGCYGLLLRGRWPVLALTVTASATLAASHLGYGSGVAAFAPLLALYSVALTRKLRLSGTLLGIVLVAVAVVLATGPYRPGGGEWTANALSVLVAWGLGRSMRGRRQHLRTVEVRNRALQEAREAETRTLLVEERARTVRELQDVVAHHLTEVSVQIAAARRLLARDPEAAAVLLQGAESTGRAALEEMRRAGGLLGAEPAVWLRPQPTLDDLDQLVAAARRAGLRVDYRRTGQLIGAAPGLELTVFRLVEEALRLVRGRVAPWPDGSDGLGGPDGLGVLDARDVPGGRDASEIRDLGTSSGPELDIAVDADAAALQVCVTCGPDRETVRWGHDPEAEDLPLLLRMQGRVAAYGGELTLSHRRDGSLRLSSRFPLERADPAPSPGQ